MITTSSSGRDAGITLLQLRGLRTVPVGHDKMEAGVNANIIPLEYVLGLYYWVLNILYEPRHISSCALWYTKVMQGFEYQSYTPIRYTGFLGNLHMTYVQPGGV